MKENDLSGKVIHFATRKGSKMGGAMPKKQPLVHETTKIITITSGKGGVGKTNIVANLGFALSRLGKKVLILDADLGLGNLDVLLGLAPKYNLSHVIQGEKQLAEVVVEGPGGLKILPAASGIQELTELSSRERHLIFSQLQSYIQEFDIMLIDTAAGISSNVLYFNIHADDILVVATPEPTSITDAYALMKVLSVQYETDNFKLVVNGATSDREADEVFRQLSLVADRFLNISIEYYGGISMDEKVKTGVRQQKVVVEMAPLSMASRNFAALARRIAGAEMPVVKKGQARWGLTDMPN